VAKQAETTAATRQAFVDAFCALRREQPSSRLTVQALTRRAGYNRGTFYEYFTNVDDLLDSIEAETIARLGEALDANLARLDIGDAFVMSFAELHDEAGKYAELLLRDPNGEKFAGRAKNAMMPVFLRRFGIDEEDLKASYAIEFYLGGVIAIGSRWLRSGRDMPVEELGTLIRTLLTEGVLSAIGRKTATLLQANRDEGGQ